MLNGLIHAIPPAWRPSRASLGLPIQPSSQQEMLAQFICRAKVCCYAHNHFKNRNVMQPRCCLKWEQDFRGIDFDWVRIFETCNSIRDTKMRYFQYKLIHRIISTNQFLSKIHVIDDPNCTFCLVSIESLTHLFWQCRDVARIWEDICKNLFNLEVPLEYDTVCSGYQEKDKKLYNLTIFYAKYYIFMCRLNKATPNYGVFKHKLRFILDVEMHVLISNKKVKELDALRDFMLLLNNSA